MDHGAGKNLLPMSAKHLCLHFFVVRYVVRSGIDINLPLGCIPKIQVPSTQHKFSDLHLSILDCQCTNLQEGIYSIP